MDNDGYPDEQDLMLIIDWSADDVIGLIAFIKTLWHIPDWGFEHSGNRLALSTGGWSGNEDIISALQMNRLFWGRYWESSYRGGHYVFDLSNEVNDESNDYKAGGGESG